MLNVFAQSVKHHIVSVLMLAGVVVFGGSLLADNPQQANQPLFSSLDQFILVAEESVHLGNNTQISSGDIATNNSLFVAENNIISGSLFADEIRIAENSSVNGNASFNTLHRADGAEILGVTPSPIALPVIELPTILPFQTGQTRLIADHDTTVQPGAYDIIEAKEGVTLTLEPGIYNLNTLNLRTGAALMFSAATSLNIRRSFSINADVLIAQSNNETESTALNINFAGNKSITTGENSFVSAHILAPEARVLLGNRNTFRGQLLAKNVQAGEGGILSREDNLLKESDPAKIVEEDGIFFQGDEILLLLEPEITLQNAQAIVALVGGRITGTVAGPNIFKVELPTSDIASLDVAIATIKNSGSSLIIEVVKNFAFTFD